MSRGSSSIAGLAFYEGGNYPAEYDDALFFTDYSRECIWVMFAGADGLPDPSTRVMFDQLDVGPVDLEIGPGGDLFYVDFDTHTIRRITFFTANQPRRRRSPSHSDQRARAAHLDFDGTRSERPGRGQHAHLCLGPRWRRPVRRLDRRSPLVHLRVRQLHRAAPGDRS